MNQQLAFWVMFVLVLTRPEIKGSKAIANDSELQSCDSQDDSEDEAQEDCSEIGSVKRSFEVLFQAQPSKTLQYKRANSVKFKLRGEVTIIFK